MRPVIIIQARMGSTRLPGKVLKPILGQPMLWHIARRLRGISSVADVVVATSASPSDQPILDFCRTQGIPVAAGSELDVLDRFYRTALQYEADPVIRVTGDCPLVDPELIERLLALYRAGDYDHVGIATGAGALFLEGGRFPDGLDAECFSFSALKQAWREATAMSDREHVTPYLWRQPERFRLDLLKSPTDYSDLRWTVDTEQDFALIVQIYAALYQENHLFLMADVLDYLEQHPELTQFNNALIGKEGYREVWDPDRSDCSI